jgi:uncharacterized protein (DUF1015 family)
MLDLAILENSVLTGVLGLSREDIALRRNLDFVRTVDEILSAVREGRAQAGIGVRPTPLEQIFRVADAGATMPQKSTYFYPKLLTGLVFLPAY